MHLHICCVHIMGYEFYSPILLHCLSLQLLLLCRAQSWNLQMWAHMKHSHCGPFELPIIWKQDLDYSPYWHACQNKKIQGPFLFSAHLWQVCTDHVSVNWKEMFGDRCDKLLKSSPSLKISCDTCLMHLGIFLGLYVVLLSMIQAKSDLYKQTNTA